MHTANGEVRFPQLLSEPVDLATGVTEDDGLRDRQRVIKIAPEISAGKD